MRSFNTRGAQAQVRLENFSGLQYRAPAKDISAAYDICNLRRMSDGTLSRREGFSPIAMLPETVRGVFCCVQEGTTVIYVVAGEHIYALQPMEDGTYTQMQIGTTKTQQGNVEFFMLDGDVVLMDGVRMYGLSPNAADVITPYIPMYGKDWTGNDYGSIYEPRNALTDQIHIRYMITSHVSSLDLRITPSTVDAVYVSGVLLGTDRYTHNTGSKSLSFTNMVSAGSTVDVLMTMPEDAEAVALREDFYRCMSALRPGEAGRTVMLFGVGNETGVLYLTREIAKEDRRRCRELFSNACMLYLQPDGQMEIGDGVHGVNAMVRHYDRTLVMTSKGTWTAQAQDLVTGATGSVFRMVNSRRGCSTPGGALSFSNTPLSICGSDVLRWSADTDALDECNASEISEAVCELLPEEMGRCGRLFTDTKRGEVWLYLSDGSARVFVWQQAQNSWTSYDFGSFAPTYVFDCNGTVGLASGRTIYLAGGDTVCDTDATGEKQPILCSYASHFLDFGHKGQTLRPFEVMVCADADAGTEITVTLEEADGAQSYVTLLATGEHPCELQKRISAGRCRHVMTRVDCAAEGGFCLRLIGLAAGL